jgi:WD40 repeat protein
MLKIRNFSKQSNIKPNKSKKHIDSEAITTTPISAAAFSHSGKTIAIGFATGELKFVESGTLQDITKITADYDISSSKIIKIAFSFDGSTCAVADADHVTILFKKQSVRVNSADATKKPLANGEEDDEAKKLKLRVEWVYIGRHRAHYKPIVSLLFSTRDDKVSLYSISKDRHLAEYDITNATVESGLQIVSIRRLEQIYNPEAAVLFKQNTTRDYENIIVTFNSGLKFRFYVAETQLCRKTVLGPTFGSTIHAIEMLNYGDDNFYALFATENVIRV